MNCRREYKLKVDDMAFLAIKELRKKVEIRVNNINDKIDYGTIKNNDIVRFINSLSEEFECSVVKVTWYKTIESLLTYEGTKYTLSSTDDFDEGVKSINSIPGYKEGIEKNGVYAIHVELSKE